MSQGTSTGMRIVLGVIVFLIGVVVGVLSLINEIWILAAIGLIMVVAGLVLSISADGAANRTNAGGGSGTRIKGKTSSYAAGEFEPRSCDRQDYEVMYRAPVKGKNGRPSYLIVRVPAEGSAALQFNHETSFDRLCKKLGIAREHATGDADFDEAVYVRGPSVGYAEKYLADGKKRSAIQWLMKQNFSQIEVSGTHVVATWPGFDPEKHDRHGATDDAARKLFSLASQLPEIPAHELASHTDWLRNRSRLSTVTLLLFAAPVIMIFLTHPAVRGGRLFLAAMAMFVVAYPIYAWLQAYLLRGSSTSHDRWFRRLTIGAPLIFFSCMGTLKAVNELPGGATPVERNLTVSGKNVGGGKSKSYNLDVPAWDTAGTVLQLSVGSAVYDQVVPGRSRVEMTTVRGCLGFDWIKTQNVIP